MGYKFKVATFDKEYQKAITTLVNFRSTNLRAISNISSIQKLINTVGDTFLKKTMITNFANQNK